MQIKIRNNKTIIALAVYTAFQGFTANAQQELERIVVSGSSYSLMTDTASSNNVLSKEAIDKMPHLADDVFRLLPSLPGVSAGDYSANFNVRGGDSDEVLVLLDGQELYRPFHMKSFFGAFSIIDTENVGQMTFSSGGYAANYGKKMSGVLDISSLNPTEDTQYSVGASFINARASAQGSFANGKGQWLTSARRGYLDIILEALEDDSNKFEPIYADLFSKVSYELNDKHTLSGHLLYAFDDEVLDDEFFEDDGRKVNEDISGKYSSTYLWLNLDSDITDSLSAVSQVSIGKLDEERDGGETDPIELSILVNDYRKLSFAGIKQDFTYLASDEMIWQFGWDYKRLDASYDYDSVTQLYPIVNNPAVTRDINLKKDGSEYSAYLSNKWRLTEDLVSEVGLRYDKQTYLGFNDDQWSPRLSLAYSVNPDSTLRFSWGHYYQAQDILSLQVTDGVTDFAKAQQSEHRILSFDSRLTNSLSVRAEVFQKHISDPLPRFENVFDQFPLFPEGQTDRVRVAPTESDIQGVEVSFNHHVTEKFSWSGNYSWSKAEDLINGRDVPRSWDQEHAVNLSFNYDFQNGWNFNTAFIFHSGWPTTGEFGTVETQPDGTVEVIRNIGVRNSQRLGDYQRIDMRVSKVQKLNDSKLTWFFEVTNLLDRENECCVDGSNYRLNEDGTVSVRQYRESWLPLIPSLGINWQF